ncbi:MAG: GDP-mannose 4,6-dehydratase, partial [Cytophagales bacterium]
AMWLMMQHHKADDFVIATGVTTTVREFILKVFNQLGIEVEFKGKDVNEVGVVTNLLNSEACVKVGDTVVKIDPKYFRPTEVELLIGDPAKAKRELKWELTHNLDTLIEDMVKSDLELFKRDNYLREGGHQIFQYHE